MILTYHEILAEESSYLYAVTCHQLDAHLWLVAELQRVLPSADRPPVITFDDGHASLHQHALRLLEKHALRSMVFVSASWVGTRSDFMTWSQLREIVSLGHEVQSHGWSHRFFTHCSEPELQDELQRSKRTIEDKLGVAVEALSAPGGRWDGRVLKACAKVGYKRVYTSNPRIRPAGREGVELWGRFTVLRTTDANRLRRLLTEDPTFLLLVRSKYWMKEALRNLLGDSIYHRLWCRLAGRGQLNDLRGV